MWKLLAKSIAFIFVLCVTGGAAFSWWKTGAIDWVPVLVIAVGVTFVGAIRFYLLLRDERAKLLRRAQAERDAAQDLVDDMARLSPGDLSIYVSAHQQQTAHGDDILFCTSGGSPNHHVLVQMTDLGLTAPAAMESIGDGAHRFVVARYKLTARGRASLGSLLAIVGKRRQFFASQQAG